MKTHCNQKFKTHKQIIFKKEGEILEPEEQPINLKQHLSIPSFRPRAKGTPAKGGWGGKELPESTTKARGPLESTKGAYWNIRDSWGDRGSIPKRLKYLFPAQAGV